jgi:hypothetical protein
LQKKKKKSGLDLENFILNMILILDYQEREIPALLNGLRELYHTFGTFIVSKE